jgi:hypothetical protein
MFSDSSPVSMPPDQACEQSKVEEIYRLYSVLGSAVSLGPQSGLGGKLLYAGEIGDQRGGNGNNLLYAANIAGAASLGASADPVVLRQAMRDGVIDFLVNSLEEALRILKNEIRKRQVVSVGVAIAPHRLVEQMLEWGVLPDLLAPGHAAEETGVYVAQVAKLIAQGAQFVAHPLVTHGAGPNHESDPFTTWSVDRQYARWLPRLDACALAVMPVEDSLRQRWLRLAPRYLGRMAQRWHGVVMNPVEAARFAAKSREMIAIHSQDMDESTSLEINGQPIV